MPIIPKDYIMTTCELFDTKTENGNNVYIYTFKKLEKKMKVIYENNEWEIEEIHYNNYPDIYFTIKRDGREKQTILNKFSL